MYMLEETALSFSALPVHRSLGEGGSRESIEENKMDGRVRPDHDTKKNESRLIRVVDAIAEATRQEMERDERVFVFGLDVDDHKSIQGSTAGLLEQFGPDRCFGTPLSEDAMTGVAIGAAMAGYRPIHVHIRMDFMMLAMNQLVNMAAKSHYMYGGQVNVPLVIRTMVGRSWGQGAQHSQALHAMFMHVPGLKVVAPSNAHDAKGCLAAAIRDDGPVIYMEHRLLCNMEAYVPSEAYETPLGQARVLHEGKDVTIVGVSHMVIESLRAAKYLEKAGISAEVIDPISLRPLDMESIARSVKKTGRLLIVDNGWLMCGTGAEIMARLIEALPNGLNGKAIPMARMGFADTPCPTTKPLENLFYPNGKTIAQRAFTLIHPAGKIDLPEDHDIKEVDEFKGPF
jgi:pyruvate dehydrogenase E1 component beta subunit